MEGPVRKGSTMLILRCFCRYMVYSFHVTKDEDKTDMDTMEQLIKAKTSDDTDHLWKIVGICINAFDRIVSYTDGEKFVTIRNINASVAKSFYYYMKHLLKINGYNFTVTKHILTNPMHKCELPNVRVYKKSKKE